ncbi:hypothetical protein [Haladaptatus sp. NG-SE-30]
MSESKGELASQVDDQELLENICIDQEEIHWRKGYTGFDRTDAERLSEMSSMT